MAVSVTHAHVTAVPDDPAYDIGSDEWNAEHAVTGLGSAAEADAADFVAVVGGSMTGPLVIDNGVVTTTDPVLTIRQEWNNASHFFDGIVIDITNTASQYNGPLFGSSILDVRIDGSSTLAVFPQGLGRSNDRFPTLRFVSIGNVQLYTSGGTSGGRWDGVNGSSHFVVENGGGFAWAATTGDDVINTSLSRAAVGVLEVNTGTAGSYAGTALGAGAQTVAQLPAASAAIMGARSCVTDSTVVAAGNFGAVVAGTGANVVPVYCDGTNWRIG